MEVQKMLITSNNKGQANQNVPKYIVLHDTGNTKQTANAMNHYKWLNNNNDTKRSAHIFVDDKQALQVIEYTTPAWHTGKYYIERPQVSDCNNYNSIGIEFCINADGNLTQTLSNTLSVVKSLMMTFNIPIERVITHQMATGKECPGTFINAPELYQNFMKQLQQGIQEDNEFMVALDYLQKRGVTNSPSYWLRQEKEVKHLKNLILNMYQILKSSER